MSKKIRKEFRIVLLAMALTLAICGIIYAFPGDRVLFAGRYPGSPLTLLSTVSGVPGNQCTICHGPSAPPLNSYGSAYLAAGGPGSVAALQTIEPSDSDGDTFSNITEINAGSFPGNAASVPPPPTDTQAPTVTSFIIPGTSNSLTVPITEFTATDNVAVTGLLITESPNTPAASGPPWTLTAPANFVFTTPGQKTLFAWAKDAANNVSTSRSQTVTITLPASDTTPPSVTSFVIPATSASLTVPISAFAAADNAGGAGVNGFMVTESSIPPLAGNPGWSATPPASFTFATAGAKTLFAWARDAANNVSTGLVSASVTITLPQTITFQDVPPTNFAFNHVEAIVAAGITRGCQADNPGTPENEALFCPDLVVDRGQMSAFIIRSLDGGDPVGGCAQAPFSDVPTSHIFCTHIEQMALRGITLGIGGNLFGPNLPVSREQMAAFLIRAVLPGNPPGVCAAPPFPDVPVDNVFCRHIEELVARTITLGCIRDNPGTLENEARFCPGNLVTRDQMAIFLGRAFLNLP